MERRRFVPSALGSQLEERALLATTAASSVFGIGTHKTAPSNLPVNLDQRLERIKNMPYILVSFQAGQTLPPNVIGPVQDDLRAIIAKIHAPSQTVLNEFNHTLRSVTPYKTLSPGRALSLVNAFDSVLGSCGTPEPLRSKFTADMLTLAKFETVGPQPTIQAINDFGTIAQLTIAVGQPFQAPGAPGLTPADKIHKANVTYNHLPTFIGDGAPDTVLQVIDVNSGQVIASGAVPKTGFYNLKAFVPLADGTHVVHSQTLDSGYASLFSKTYTFKVFTHSDVVPSGPRR